MNTLLSLSRAEQDNRQWTVLLIQSEKKFIQIQVRVCFFFDSSVCFAI